MQQFERSILIADPDGEVRSGWRTVLEAAGYRVLEAVDGIAALRILMQDRVDLAILTLVMPEQDGLQTMRLMRKEGMDCSIIATANLEYHGYLRIAEALGAAEVIRKPASTRSVLKIVNRVLAGRNPSRSLTSSYSPDNLVKFW